MIFLVNNVKNGEALKPLRFLVLKIIIIKHEERILIKNTVYPPEQIKKQKLPRYL